MEFIYAYLIEGFGNYDGFLDVNWYALFFFYAVDPPSRCGRPSLELYLRSLRMWRCRGIGVSASGLERTLLNHADLDCFSHV